MLFYMWQKGTRAVAILVARCLKMHGCAFRFVFYPVRTCLFLGSALGPPTGVSTYISNMGKHLPHGLETWGTHTVFSCAVVLGARLPIAEIAEIHSVLSLSYLTF
jgi:hypothetical protein